MELPRIRAVGSGHFVRMEFIPSKRNWTKKTEGSGLILPGNKAAQNLVSYAFVKIKLKGCFTIQ